LLSPIFVLKHLSSFQKMTLPQHCSKKTPHKRRFSAKDGGTPYKSNTNTEDFDREQQGVI